MLKGKMPFRTYYEKVIYKKKKVIFCRAHTPNLIPYQKSAVLTISYKFKLMVNRLILN